MTGMCPERQEAPDRGEMHHGVELLHDPVRNKGTAFTEAERDALGLRGLLPPAVLSQDVQVARVMENLRRQTSDLERYIALISLQDRNEMLFYRVLLGNLAELIPIIYTPTVGEACQVYGHIFQRPRGLFISARDRGRMSQVLGNWPHRDVRIIVVTDGERILGLGDLGANGMGIPVGKLSLYTACAGIHPTYTLPVTLDVGTSNQSLLEDPMYIGLRQERLRGTVYEEFVDEFMTAAAEHFPRAVIQLEDFATRHAFELLTRYQDRVAIFDDDIQGTAAVALAGLYSVQRIIGGSLRDGCYLFLGAGEAGIGIGDLLVAAMIREGMAEEEARLHCWFLDSRGLVVKSRTDLPPHKLPFAHDHAPIGTLEEAIDVFRPTALIGASGVPGAFTQGVVERMAAHRDRPVIFALSNPTSRSECTAEQAYRWTGGRAVFASGSPFDPVDIDGQRFVPGQSNNVHVFPGVGLGAIVSRARRITPGMLYVAARTLARLVTPEDLAVGRVFPPLERARQTSAAIAEGIAREAQHQGLAEAPGREDLAALISEEMFDPTYPEYC